ncbi:hypothetical protein MP228_006754 [Amoeboaphelidium protococcarum]|nr:hypothetical protein MP228_006754 [Amoeboaphelidium protococcarum]
MMLSTITLVLPMCYNYDVGSGGRQESRVLRWSMVFWLWQNVLSKQLIASNKMSNKSIVLKFFNGYYLIQFQALWPFTHVQLMLFARSIANVKGAVNKKCNLLGRTVDNEHYCL